MKYVYFKRSSKIDDSTPLQVHFGIFRTGSSTVRAFIRRHCNLTGKSWRPFKPKDTIEQQTETISQAHFLLLEHPFPVHLLTKRPVVYHTTIRHPIEQINSLYHWQRNLNQRQSSFEEFVDSLPENFNMNCRWFHALSLDAIDDTMKEQHAFLKEQYSEKFYSRGDAENLCNQALDVIANRFGLTAPLEEMAFFVMGLAAHTSMSQLPVLQRINFSTKPERFDFSNLPQSIQTKLHDCTLQDLKLYEAVKSEFERTKQNIKKKQPGYEEYLSICSHADQSLLNSNGLVLDGQDILSPKTASRANQVGLLPKSRQHYLDAQDFLDQHEYM